MKAEYLHLCKGTYQVIPVAVFIMTLYTTLASCSKQTRRITWWLKHWKDLIWHQVLTTMHFLKLWVSTSRNIHSMNILSSVQSTNHITAEKTIIQFNQIDCISWFHLNASYVLGNKIAKNRECPFNDLGKPQFFYKVVQNWVAF